LTAPATAFQLKLTGFGTSVALLAGLDGVADPFGHVGPGGGAGALTVERTLAELFVGSGSAIGEDTETELLSVPAEAGAVTLMVINALWPLDSAVVVHVSVGLAKPQVTGPLVLAYVTPTGKLSTIVALGTDEGPLLVIVTA